MRQISLLLACCLYLVSISVVAFMLLQQETTKRVFLEIRNFKTLVRPSGQLGPGFCSAILWKLREVDVCNFSLLLLLLLLLLSSCYYFREMIFRILRQLSRRCFRNGHPKLILFRIILME